MCVESRKFFSIIIPTYNSEVTIARALNSIFSQSFHDWEVIIIDGASTDKTLSIIQNYSHKHAGINYISEKDNGVYNAMNKGIKMAQGEWIYFLGSDDMLHDNNVLVDVFSQSKSNEVNVIYGNVQIITNTSWANDGQVYDGVFTTEKLLSKNICHQSIFYRRAFVLQAGYFNTDYNICADWDFNLRCWGRTKFAYVNRVIADFYGGGESSKKSSDENFAKDFVPNIVQYFQLSPYHPLLNQGKLATHPDVVQLQKKLGYFKYILNKIKRKLIKIHE